MESSWDRPKSLVDTLLEYAVLNVSLLFPPQGLESKACDFVKVPVFPNYLFDDILEKSKDMCRPISKMHLIPCIASRDRLKWSETSCFRFVNNFSAEDLKFFAGNINSLETFKVTVSLDEKNDCIRCFKAISRTADTLEDLDLTVRLGKSSHSLNMQKIKASMRDRAPLKLKRLVLDIDSFESFPFDIDSDRLIVFELFNCVLTRSLLETLVGFKRLAHLTLFDSDICQLTLREVVDSVVSLKGLRFLNLWTINERVDEFMLNKIVENLENLDTLELMMMTLNKPEKLSSPKRKLKVLNYRWLLCSSNSLKTAAESALTRLAQKIGNFESVSGILTFVSSTKIQELYPYAVNTLLNSAEGMEEGCEMLIGAEKMGLLKFRSPLRLNESFDAKTYGSTSYDVLLKMACYYMNTENIYTFEFFRKWVKNFVMQNKNRNMAVAFNNYLKITKIGDD